MTTEDDKKQIVPKRDDLPSAAIPGKRDIKPRGKVYSSEEEALEAISSADGEIEIVPDPHYSGIAKKFKVVRFIVLFVAVLATLIGIMNFSPLINIADVKEFIHSFTKENDSTFNFGVSLNSMGLMDIGVYKNYVAMVRKGSLELYRSDGKEDFFKSFSMQSPKLVTTDRYAAVYDQGGNTLNIYNAVDTVYEYSFDSPLYLVDMGKNGNIAVLSKKIAYTSAITVYGTDLSEKFSWTSPDKYTSVMKFFKDGNVLLTASFNSVGGEPKTYLNVFDIKRGTTAAFEFADTLPMSINVFENGFCLVCNDRIAFFDKDFKQTGCVSLDTYGNTLKDVSSDEKYIAVVMKSKSESALVIFDQEGKLIKKHNESSTVINSVACTDRCVYVLGSGYIEKIHFDETPSEKSLLSDYYSHVLKYIDGKLVLSSSDNAATIIDVR